MSGRAPLPWWERRQATIVAGAARRAGLNPTARLDGWLEIRTDDGQTVASAKFSQTSGALLNARGLTATEPRRIRLFRPEQLGLTARETTDVFADWLRDHRPFDFEQEKRRRHPVRGDGDFGTPPEDDRPVAPVVDLASRRKNR